MIKGKLSNYILKLIKEEYNKLQYPLASKDNWYGDADYETRGGKMVYITPDEFLNMAKTLIIDDSARENIEDLKDHIRNGNELDPLVIYNKDKTQARNSDGRHRAIASKELGIFKVPVIIFH